MDLIKIGNFITTLRKENNLTQEELGEKLFVTNKTISRWETGVYLPPIEAFVEMSKLFNVSINELLAGKRLTNDEYKDAAEENIKEAIKASSFTLKEKINFFKKKWYKEHIALIILIGIVPIALYVVGFILRESLIGYIAVLLAILAFGHLNNKKQAFIEKYAFDGSGKR